MNIFQTIKKYPKDSCITIAVIILGLLAVLGDGFSDFAKRPFWWKFWSISGIVSFLALFIGWLYLVARDKSSRKGQ